MSKQTAMTALAHLNGRPVYLDPTYAETGLIPALSALAAADFNHEQAESLRRRQALCAAYGMDQSVMPEKPFAFAGGLAFIPIHGLLVNRFAYSWGWVTGYDFIRQQMNAAAADADVKAIVFDVNSPGGMAWGCEELGNEIVACDKPTLAVVDANCCSAAYWLSSAADKVALTPSGQAGSIGVYVMHMDVSGALEQAGVKITFVKAGQRKVDGNPYEVLSEEAKAEIQAKVDASYGKFTGAVAEFRGISVQKVEETEARVFDADAALSLGLVDAVQSPSEAVQSWMTSLSGSDDTTEQDVMANERQEQNQVDTQAVITAERTRVAAIQDAPEAEGRGALAKHLALRTDMTVEAAVAVLAVSPKETAAPAAPTGSPFHDAMNRADHPNVGAGNGDQPTAGGGTTKNRLLESLAALGFKPDTAAVH